ncbi:hypothetical protein KKG71_04835 [Patescibacteria group bacterium]|nr:hypothetical protein [Patescibacteria group bacterium]
MQQSHCYQKPGAPEKCERKPSERCERSEQDSEELSSIFWGEERHSEAEEASAG